MNRRVNELLRKTGPFRSIQHRILRCLGLKLHFRAEETDNTPPELRSVSTDQLPCIDSRDEPSVRPELLFQLPSSPAGTAEKGAHLVSLLSEICLRPLRIDPAIDTKQSLLGR